MSDPRHMHEYEPNKRGLCQRIVGGAYCHLPELAMVHKRYAESQEEAQENAMSLNPNKIGVSVECIICYRQKQPRGRSAPLEMANGLCDRECSGYELMPYAGSLWPGESEADFGYPAGEDGTQVTA